MKALADIRAKGVFITGNDSIRIKLYVQDGADKDNFVGEIELLYNDDVARFGNDPNEEYQPDMNEWTISYRARIDDYTDHVLIYQGHVYPATSKTKGKQKKDDLHCADCYRIDPTGNTDCPRHRK